MAWYADSKTKQVADKPWRVSPGPPWLGPFPSQKEAEIAVGGPGNPKGGGSGRWYVVTIRRSPQTPFTVEVMQKPFPSGSGITVMIDHTGGVSGAGYPTQAAAEAAARGYKSQLVPGIQSSALGIGGITSVLSAFYTNLTDGKMWRSVGWLALGIVFLVTGLYLWMKNSGMMPKINAGDVAALAA